MSIFEIIFGGGGMLLVVLTMVQISPIKINPWSAIAKAIGRALNKELTDKVAQLTRDVEKLQNEVAQNNVTVCRARILAFGDEILHGVKHSKDSYEQVLSDMDTYEEYCRSHPNFKNNMTYLTSQRIKETYTKHLSDNSFL